MKHGTHSRDADPPSSPSPSPSSRRFDAKSGVQPAGARHHEPTVGISGGVSDGEPTRLKYVRGPRLGRGGMATVYIGAMRMPNRSAAEGETRPDNVMRVVAIKEMHPHLADDERIRSMFVDEAYLASRVVHPNVVQLLEVQAEGELTLVMDYVRGVSLFDLLLLADAAGERVPQAIAFAIARDLLAGLQAAHEARGENGEPLGIVHRDVSPHNLMVGTDGRARLLDFGIAWAKKRTGQATDEGKLKGKLAYMAPEQFEELGVDHRTDIYSAGIVLWEMLSGQRMFELKDLPSLVVKKLDNNVDKPSERRRSVADTADAVIMRALMRDPGIRFQSARDMRFTLEANCICAEPEEISRWVERLAEGRLEQMDRVAEQLCKQVEALDSDSAGELRRSVRPTAPAGLSSTPVMPIVPRAPGMPRMHVDLPRTTQRMLTPVLGLLNRKTDTIPVPPILTQHIPDALRRSMSRSRQMQRASSRKRAVISIAIGFVLGGCSAFAVGALTDHNAAAEQLLKRDRELHIEKNAASSEAHGRVQARR